MEEEGMAINAFGIWDKGLQGYMEGKTFLKQRQLMQTWLPAVSLIADVIVVGLVLLWRLTNLWDYLHFCMEKEEKTAS